MANKSRKTLQQRAIARARKMAKPHCGERSCLDCRLSQAWLRGYEAARRDAAKTARKPVGHGIEGPTGPRGVSPTRVRDASNPTAFSIVSTDDGTGEVLTIPALGSRPKYRVDAFDCDHGSDDCGNCKHCGTPLP